MKRRTGWALVVAANVLFCCVLSFTEVGNTASGASANEPFANSVAQRMEMIRLLGEINEQLKEQNALLRSGELKVVVAQPQSQPDGS
jgi:hypothetical protein